MKLRAEKAWRLIAKLGITKRCFTMHLSINEIHFPVESYSLHGEDRVSKVDTHPGEGSAFELGYPVEGRSFKVSPLEGRVLKLAVSAKVVSSKLAPSEMVTRPNSARLVKVAPEKLIPPAKSAHAKLAQLKKVTRSKWAPSEQVASTKMTTFSKVAPSKRAQLKVASAKEISSVNMNAWAKKG